MSHWWRRGARRVETTGNDTPLVATNLLRWTDAEPRAREHPMIGERPRGIMTDNATA
jgi:hypothetical protein